jgi:ABC-type transport system involved in Fe-S cluster assembly fused permease/ATPase subunit
VISEQSLQTVLNDPEEELRWASGGFLSDFNKGGSLNKCLEELLFAWIPLVLDLFTTTIYIWILLGPIYGLVIDMISSWYVYCIIRNARRSVCWSREVVEAKRSALRLDLIDIVGVQYSIRSLISCSRMA